MLFLNRTPETGVIPHADSRSAARLVGFLLLAMIALLPAGAAAQSKSLNTFHLQLVHASPDAALDEIDLYGDDSRLSNDLPRYEVTPFFTVVGGNTFRYSAASDTSASSAEAIIATTEPAVDDAVVMAALVGVVDPPEGFNPDGIDVSLSLSINPFAERANPTPETLLINVLHAAPSAKAMWVHVGWDQGSPIPIADSLSFGSYSDYVEVDIDSTSTYFYVFESEQGPFATCSGDVLVRFEGCLQIQFDELKNNGNVLTLVLEDIDVSGGDLLAASAVFPNGVSVPISYYLTLDVESDHFRTTGSVNSFPSPADDRTTIQFETARAARADLEIVDITGRIVASTELGAVSPDAVNQFEVETDNLFAGLYFLRVRLHRHTGNEVLLGKLVVVR
ncbi:MAG: T9SS type A sorting domain-containing protein [Rhodothermales bacterium]|nr:T9SS type A sorting domain-containing protein [Rhodothermales bacterium]